MEIKQLKLTNNDEIICEVLDWDEEDGDVVIRNPFRIVQGEDHIKGVRYYFLKPFMLYQDENLQVLNSGHVICELSPSESLLDYYKDAIKTAEQDSKTRQTINTVTEENEISHDKVKEAMAEIFNSMVDKDKIIH